MWHWRLGLCRTYRYLLALLLGQARGTEWRELQRGAVSPDVTDGRASRHRGNGQGSAWMANDRASAWSRLSALVAEIEAQAHARGRADAREEIRAALGVAREPAPRPGRETVGATRPARGPRTDGGRRAPRGTVRALVERTLRSLPETTPLEILECAASNAERLVKLASIRNELQTGRRQNRYASRDGRWSLAVSSSAVDDDEPDAPESSAAASAGTHDNGPLQRQIRPGNQPSRQACHPAIHRTAMAHPENRQQLGAIAGSA